MRTGGRTWCVERKEAKGTRLRFQVSDRFEEIQHLRYILLEIFFIFFNITQTSYSTLVHNS